MTGGEGGSNRGSYFIPKKITTSEFVYPKKSLTVVPFSQPKKIPLFSSHDPKKSQHLSFLSDPKKSLWPKFQTQKNHSDPPVIKICEYGPWGEHVLYIQCI